MVCLQHSQANHFSVISEEQALLNQLAQGDNNAFWQLWQLHQNYFYHRCQVWMGGNHDDAQEAMSLAVWKAWYKLPSYAQNITNFKGWLYKLIHNLCIDIHRQRHCHAVYVEDIESILLKSQETESFAYNNPESALLQQELKIYLRYCIDALPSRLRDSLILHYYQEMSYADIGAELAISQDNVAKRLQQAKQVLKKRLCQYLAGFNTVAIDEVQLQELEHKSFQLPIQTNHTIEEIDYRITISCLETLPPVWCSFHPTQD
ncbi:MAG: RNA polymerase sigma factor [Spirulinaceae cyanobacterium]